MLCLLILTVFLVGRPARALDPAPSGEVDGRHFEPMDTPEYQERSHNMPLDVQKYLARAIECHHWRTEPSYDKARKKWLKTRQRQLDCRRLKTEARLLHKKYKKKLPIRDVVDKAASDFT